MPKQPTTRVYDSWWKCLHALPPSRNSSAYRRLRHLWTDPTRKRPKKIDQTEKRKKTIHPNQIPAKDRELFQEFYISTGETHLTAVLWENFAVLKCQQWLPALAAAAGLHTFSKSITAANWSYGWVAKPQIMDIVVHYCAGSGADGVLIIEAKSPWGNPLRGKDLDPGYYLDHARLSSFQTKSLIYLVDETVIDSAREAVQSAGHPIGFLSWQELGNVQIAAANSLSIANELKSFIAAAIQRQFAEFGILTREPAVGYLVEEPTRQQVEVQPKHERQTSKDRESELWRLPTAAPLKKVAPQLFEEL